MLSLTLQPTPNMSKNELFIQAQSYLARYFAVNLEKASRDIPKLPPQLRQKVIVQPVIFAGAGYSAFIVDDISLFERQSAGMLHKLVERYENENILFILPAIHQRQRGLFVTKQWAVVSVDTFAYVPELLFHAEFKEKREQKDVSTLSVIATMIVERYLNGLLKQGFKTGDIVKELDVSRSAISRALNELSDVQIVEKTLSGRSLALRFKQSRKELWAQKRDVLSVLASKPIKVVSSLFKNLSGNESIDCGLSALSYYTMAGAPQLSCQAVSLHRKERLGLAMNSSTIDSISQGYIEQLAERKGIDIESLYPTSWIDEEKGKYETVQVFPYPPASQKRNGARVLTPVSLALSLKEEREPRMIAAYRELSECVEQQLCRVEEQEDKDVKES
jgi:hypothetical protein